MSVTITTIAEGSGGIATAFGSTSRNGDQNAFADAFAALDRAGFATGGFNVGATNGGSAEALTFADGGGDDLVFGEARTVTPEPTTPTLFGRADILALLRS